MAAPGTAAILIPLATALVNEVREQALYMRTRFYMLFGPLLNLYVGGRHQGNIARATEVLEQWTGLRGLEPHGTTER